MDPNNDKLNGTINVTVGSLKERAGIATGDKNMEAEGSIQKTKGQFQKLSGAIKDTIQKGKTLLGIKGKISLILILTATFAGTGWNAYADEDKSATNNNTPITIADNDGDHDGQMGDMKEGPMESMDKWKEKLDITDLQDTQLKALFKKNRGEMQLLKDKRKLDLDTLQQKLDSKATSGDLKGQLDTLSADRRKMESVHRKMEDSIREILNPTQQAKFVLCMEERMEMGMGKMMKNRDHEGKGEGKHGHHPDADTPANNDSKGDTKAE